MKKNTRGQNGRPAGRIDDYGFDSSLRSLGRAGGTRRKKRRALQRRLAALAVAVIIAGALWLAWPLLTGQQPGETTAGSTSVSDTSPETSASSQEGTTTLEPTLTTEPASTTLSPDELQARIDQAAAEVTDLLEGSPGRYAVYYQDLSTGKAWQYNADAPFVAASSIKLGINTYLYTLMASGQISPDEVLSYDSRPYPTGDYEAGTGTIQGQPNGTQYSVRDTSGLSIRISDNCATNMIIRKLGGIDTVNTYLSSISHVVDYRTKVSYTNYAGTAQNGRHRTSATDLGLYAVNLFQLWQADPDIYQPLIDDLCHTEFDFGIQKGIPSGVAVAHKIGTNGTYSAENDVGIVLTDEPFVLCVMTEMASAQAAHQIQAEVATIFYANLTGSN